MNLHWDLNGQDWRMNDDISPFKARTDLFWDGVDDEIVELFEKTTESLPALLESAYAALGVKAGQHQILVFSVAEAGHAFPVDQANAGLDVVYIQDGDVEKRDQAVSIVTAGRALFDILAYAAQRNHDPSVVIADRQAFDNTIDADVEGLYTEQVSEARWTVAGDGMSPSFPHMDIVEFPDEYDSKAPDTITPP